MEESLKKRAKNRMILDLRGLKSLREISSILDELSPLAGYFSVSSSILASHSLTAVLLGFKTKAAKVMLDLNLNLPPDQMVSWAEQLRSSGVAMVTIHCSSGYVAMKAFMDEIKKNDKRFNDDHDTSDDSMFSSPRPMVFAIAMPPHMEQSVASSVFGDVGQKSVMFNGYIQRSEADGVICNPASLKSYHNGYFDRIFKLATDVVPEGMNPTIQRRTITPAQAINHGADYLMIREPIVSPPPGYTSKGEAERMVVEIAHALQAKDRLRKIPSPAKPTLPVKTRTIQTTK